MYGSVYIVLPIEAPTHDPATRIYIYTPHVITISTGPPPLGARAPERQLLLRVDGPLPALPPRGRRLRGRVPLDRPPRRSVWVCLPESVLLPPPVVNPQQNPHTSTTKNTHHSGPPRPRAPARGAEPAADAGRVHGAKGEALAHRCVRVWRGSKAATRLDASVPSHPSPTLAPHTLPHTPPQQQHTHTRHTQTCDSWGSRPSGRRRTPSA